MSRAGEMMLSATRALCSECGALVDAQIVERGGAVYLVKWCGEHGRTEALTCGDAEWYRRSLSYVKPGTRPRKRAVEGNQGCPGSCGLCEDHRQHTCVPLLEITADCDLACPICLVDGIGVPELSPEEVANILDGLERTEGRIHMLTLTGGEPTRHPHFLEIVDLCRGRPEVGIVSVSTNGLRLSRDEELLRALCERGVVISLQFDGLEPGPSLDLRGRSDLAQKKLHLLERIGELDGRASLTLTLARDVNEAELPGVLELLFSMDHILSIMVQPLARAGRAAKSGLRPVTIPETVKRLADASGGVLLPTDFTPLPCSHPSCFALTYLLKAGDGRYVPLPRLLEESGYLDLIKNQALVGTDARTLEAIRDALYRLWSSNGIVPERDAVLETVRGILLDLARLGSSAGPEDLLELGLQNVKSVFIHHFMDRETFDLSRAVKCCNHYPQRDGRLIPACVRNVGLAPRAR